MCNVYIAELIPVYFIKALLNWRLPFTNNYSALIATRHTFALQTPQSSTAVTISCLSCALKCCKKKYGVPSGSCVLIKSIGIWRFKKASHDNNHRLQIHDKTSLFVFISISYNSEYKNHFREQSRIAALIARSLWSNFIFQVKWRRITSIRMGSKSSLGC